MLHKLNVSGGGELSEAIAESALQNIESSDFPVAAFEVLRRAGATSDPLVKPGDFPDLLRLLVAVGRGDLSTGRVFEGHANTCWLIETFGTVEQHAELRQTLAHGGLFGVWNTDDPQNPLTLVDGKLRGAKNFASGADGLTHAVVTITTDLGREMLLVPLDGLPVDRSWWKPLGMKASGSHIVDFTGVEIDTKNVLGKANDYVTQPWFTAGAARFLAVQLGGVHAIFDIAREHLVRTNRAENPFQAHRLARMGVAIETGYLWIERLGQAWLRAEDSREENDQQYLMASVNAARLAIEQLAMTVLSEAEQSIGAAGMIAPHPFERRMRDLRTYLRQPNPDGAVTAFGKSISEGEWSPGERLTRAAFDEA